MKKRWNRAKLSLSERKNRVAQKKASFLKTLEEVEAQLYFIEEIVQK